MEDPFVFHGSQFVRYVKRDVRWDKGYGRTGANFSFCVQVCPNIFCPALSRKHRAMLTALGWHEAITHESLNEKVSLEGLYLNLLCTTQVGVPPHPHQSMGYQPGEVQNTSSYTKPHPWQYGGFTPPGSTSSRSTSICYLSFRFCSVLGCLLMPWRPAKLFPKDQDSEDVFRTFTGLLGKGKTVTQIERQINQNYLCY